MRDSRLALAIAILFVAIECKGAEEIRFWQLSLRPRLAEELAREFERQHPGVNVSVETLSWEDGFEKLVLAIASRTEPDVFELGSTWIAQLRSAGVLATLNSLDARIGGDLVLRQPGRTAGNVDALPWLLGTRVMFVNRDTLRRAGITENPRTVEDLLRSCEAIATAGLGRACIGLAAGDPYAPWQQLFSFAWTEDPSFIGETIGVEDLRSPALRRATSFYERLRPSVRADRPAALDRDFVEGRLPIVISGAWLPLIIRDSAPHLDYEAAPIPSLSGGPTHAFGGGEYLVIARRTPKTALAEEFLEFLLDPGVLTRVMEQQPGLLAAHRGAVAPSLDPATTRARAVFQAQLETAATPPADPNWAGAESTLSSIVDRVLLKGSSADSALAAATSGLERVAGRAARRSQGIQTRHLLFLLEMFVGVVLLLYVVRRETDGVARLSRVPWLALFAALYAIPSAYLLIVSFASTDLLASRADMTGFENYRQLLLDPTFHRAIIVTSIFVAASVPITFALALLMAYGVRMLRSLGRVCEAIVYLPPILPAVVTATLIAALFAGGGAIDYVLGTLSLPVPRPPWLLNERAALVTVVVHAVWTSFGYYALLFAAALAAIPQNVHEAAILDRASPWMQFRAIEWPVIKPVALLVVLLHTIRSIQVFPEIVVLTSGGPVGATTTIVYYLYEEAFRRFDFGRAAAVATLLMAAVAALSVPILSRMRRSV